MLRHGETAIRPRRAGASIRRWRRRSGARRPRWPADGPGRARLRPPLPHQRGVVRRDGAVAQLQVVLEAYAHVAAESRRGRDAGVLLWSESADGPGQRMVAGGQEGQQIVGGRGLPAQRPRTNSTDQAPAGASPRWRSACQRRTSASSYRMIWVSIAALGQPCQEGRQLAFRDLGHGDLAQADGDGLGRQFAHHRHLLGGAVTPAASLVTCTSSSSPPPCARRPARRDRPGRPAGGVRPGGARACASWPRRRQAARASRPSASAVSGTAGWSAACFRRRWAPR